MTESEVTVMFRWPRLPVIVLSSQGLAAAMDRKQLIDLLRDTPPSESMQDVKVIDSEGWEFWFGTDKRILAPGLGAKKWTKKRLIEMHNAHLVPGRDLYTLGSISNHKLERIIGELAGLLTKHNAEEAAERRSTS